MSDIVSNALAKLQNDVQVPQVVIDTVAAIKREFKYGDEISHEWLEHHLMVDRDSTAYSFAVMALTPILKSGAMRLSKRGTNGKGYRILLREEMGEFVVTQEIQKMVHTRSNNEMLVAVDTEGMSEAAINEMQYATNLTAAIFLNGKALVERKTIPARVIPMNPMQIGRQQAGDPGE